jgi:alcohol dehydrogenase class IV
MQNINTYSDMFEQYSDTTIIFGEQCMLEFENLMRIQKPDKILVFSSKNSATTNNAWSKILHSTIMLDTTVARFSEINPEPDIDMVEKMIMTIKNESPDQIVAVGGGSVMDAAKAALLVHQCGGNVSNYFGLNHFSQSNPGVTLKKVICFPTTSGTGSEVTPYANIVDRQNQCKRLIIEKEIIPDFSFVLPEMSSSMPKEVVLTTGCDALAHAIEGYLNVDMDNIEPHANQWAYEAIKLIVNNLPLTAAGNNQSVAQKSMSAAATLSGMVIRYKPTGLPHLCSFSWFDRITHGIAVAILLGPAWQYYLKRNEVRERTMLLNDIFPGNTPEDIILSYRKFISSVGVPEKLKDIPAINPELLKFTAQSAVQNRIKLEQAPCPVPLEQSEEILCSILDKAWSGI